MTNKLLTHQTPFLYENELSLNRLKHKSFYTKQLLFHQKYMFEFFPVSNMSYQQKLNQHHHNPKGNLIPHL